MKKSEAAFEGVVGLVLQFGVMISAFIVLDGLAASWLLTGSPGFTPEELGALRNGQLVAEGAVPRSLGEFQAGLAHADAGAIVSIGILALIALPILRVALTSVLFLIRKDFLYFGFTVLVLGTLFTGILLGKGL
ncbi:MAG: DUF1634 domain-containing protein [Bdellovibrionales bacterium]|nr:DUF1634 domain-containing protein [Bdellovibrionales bacterium]